MRVHVRVCMLCVYACVCACACVLVRVDVDVHRLTPSLAFPPASLDGSRLYVLISRKPLCKKSNAKVIGLSVGGVALLALVLGFAAFIMHKRRWPRFLFYSEQRDNRDSLQTAYHTLN